jgi:hypothetical protein
MNSWRNYPVFNLASPVVANTAYNQHSYYTGFISDHVFYTPFCLYIELLSIP